MMGFKHLHELLKEDQEPFQLKSYISDKRYQLKRPNNPSNTLQIKKNITIVTKKSSLATKHSFCKNACFLSFQNSPDVRKSPCFDFPSPSKKSPLIRNGAVLLHVPAKTAALLFEAALRVQSQRNSKEKRGVGFGILGSILKKFKERNTNKQSSRHIPVVTTLRNRNKKKQIGKNVIEVEQKCVEQERSIVSGYQMRSCGYCNNSRLSSAGWSESNEEKSLDLESSCSEEFEDYSLEEAFAAYEKRFCSSPLSSFRFSLRRSPSGHRTPELSSPAASPRGQNGKKQEQTEGSNIVLEDEKEQCSPVSVLDTPYEAYDDDGLECGDEEEYEDNDYYVEDYNESNGSYAIVQEANVQLLDKLRRFEKLAELDPIELDKIMIERMEEDYKDKEPTSLGRDIDNPDTPMLTEILSHASFQQSRKFPTHLERLVLDLISEETKEMMGFNFKEEMVSSICKKLSSWQEVQPHTIDMMVQFDFGSECGSWKKYREQSGEIAGELEVAIFRVLVDELADELCY